MTDIKLNRHISEFMNYVQIATMSDKEVTDSDYIDSVNERITEVEKAISELKYELTKHNLNDWE